MENRKRGIKVNDLFDKVLDMLKLETSQKETLIGDFYTMISTDKRFIALDSGLVDLKSRHSIKKIKVDHSDEEDDDIIEYESITELMERDEDLHSDKSESDDDFEEDEFKDLVIVDENDME